MSPAASEYMERAAQNPRFLAYLLNSMDEDGDGVLSPDEMSNL